MRWWFSCGWLVRVWKKRRRRQPARRGGKPFRPQLEVLEERRLFAGNVWLPTQLATFDGTSQTNLAMPIFQPGATTFLPQLGLQATSISATGSVSLTDNGSYQLDLTQSGPYDDNGDDYTFTETGPVQFSLVEQGNLSATGFSITSITLTQTATLSWSLVETNSSGLTVQNLSGVDTVTPTSSGAAPFDPFFWQGFNWQSLTQQISSLNTLGLSSLAADSLSVTQTDGSEGYTFQETNGVATVSGSVQQPLSDSLLESGQDSYSETAVEQLDNTLTGSDSFALTELGCYGSGSYALSSVSYQETGTQSRQFNATVVDSQNGNGSESGAQSFSGSNNSLGYSSSDSFVFNDVSTLSYGETASSNYTLTQSGSFGSGSFSLDCLSYNANGSGGYSLTQTSLQTQDGSFSDSDNASGADSYGVAGTLSDSGTSTDAGNFTTTSGGTLQDNESGNFTLSEGGAYGNGSWALSSYSYSDSLSGTFSRQQPVTTTRNGNATVTDSGTGSDSFQLLFGSSDTTSGGGTLDSTDTSIDSFTETSTSSSTQSGPSSTTLSEQGAFQNGSVSLSCYVYTSGQSGSYTANGTDNESDDGSAQDTASGSDCSTDSAINGSFSDALGGNDSFLASDSFSFTSSDSTTSSDGGSFSQSVSQSGVFNNGSWALSNVSQTSTQNDNWSQTSSDSSSDSGSDTDTDGDGGHDNSTIQFGGDSITGQDTTTFSDSDFATFVDSAFDTITAAGFSQFTLTQLGSYSHDSFSFGAVTYQDNGTSTDTAQESDDDTYTDTSSDGYLDSGNQTGVACLANSSDTGSGSENGSGNDVFDESGIDTITETVSANDSYNDFESGSFLSGLWSLSSISSADSGSDSFSEQDLDSSSDSGTDYSSSNGSDTNGDTAVYGGGVDTGSSNDSGSDTGSDTFSDRNNDTLTDSGGDTFQDSEQGSYGNFSFDFTSVVYQGGDSDSDTDVESSNGTSVGVESDNYSDDDGDSGQGTYAFGTDSNSASETVSGSDSFSTGGSDSLTETDSSSESDSFYDAGQFVGGTLVLSLVSYHDGGSDTWLEQSQDTSTDSGSTGESDSGMALLCVALGASSGSGGDNVSDSGNESDTSYDSSTDSGSDSWSLTEIGSFSNGSYSYASFVSQDGGNDNDTLSESSTDSFSGTFSDSGYDDGSQNNSGVSGYESLSDQAGDDDGSNACLNESDLGQDTETVTSSDSWSDYQAGVFNNNSWSLSSVTSFSGDSDTWSEQDNDTVTDSGPETVSGGDSFSGGDTFNGDAGATMGDGGSASESDTLAGTDTSISLDSASESGNDSWSESDAGSYGNFSFAFTSVVIQGGGNANGCVQDDATDTFVGLLTAILSDSGQESGTDNVGVEDANSSGQMADSGTTSDNEQIDSQDTLTGGNSDTWSEYESGSYAGDSYAFSSYNYQDNGSDSSTDDSLGTSYGTLSGSGCLSDADGDNLEDTYFAVALNASTSDNAYGSITGHDTGTDSMTAQQGDSWSLTELGCYSNGSYALNSYVSSSSDSRSVNSQETDSVMETVTGSGFQSDSNFAEEMASVQGTWTTSGTMPMSGTFGLSPEDNRDINAGNFVSETTTVTETTMATDVETFSDSQSQLGVYAAGSFNLTTVTHSQSSSASTTETSTDGYGSSETSQGNSDTDDGDDGYGSDGYGVNGSAALTGQETGSGGDTATDQDQSSESVYQSGSFSNDSYSLSSYHFSASGSDTVVSSSSDTFTSLGSGSDSGTESIDGWDVYLGNGTFTSTGSGSDGSAGTQNDSWSLTELGSMSAGVMALSCYVFSEQESSSASSNDSSGWTETLSGTNQGDNFTGTDSGSDSDSQSSSVSGSLLEQGTATGDVLTLSLVSYSGSGNENGSASENEGGPWSGQSYSGNDSDNAQSGENGSYSVSALGCYSNGSYSLSSYVLQGSATDTSSSGASEQDTLATLVMGSVVLENFSRSDTTSSRQYDPYYQSGVETGGVYANVSLSEVGGSVATVTSGTSAPSYSSSDNWQTTAMQTETLSGASASDSSSLSFQDTGESGGGSCFTQTTPTLTAPGLLVNLTVPDASSVPVVGADESSGGMDVSTPNVALAQATGEWLYGTGSSAQEETQPDSQMPMVPATGGGSPAQAPAPGGFQNQLFAAEHKLETIDPRKLGIRVPAVPKGANKAMPGGGGGGKGGGAPGVGPGGKGGGEPGVGPGGKGGGAPGVPGGAGKPPEIPKDIKKEIDRVNVPLSVARSAADHAALQADLHGRLRDLYHKGDQAIRETAAKMLREGKSPEQVANWRAAARNDLKTAIRNQGNALVDYYYQNHPRGAGDKPTADQLRRYYKQKYPGLSEEKINAEIIGSGPQKGVDKFARALKIGGRIAIVADVAAGSYRVYTAPDGQKLKQVLREAARMEGAYVGGLVGAKIGASVGGFIGSFFGPGPGTAIGAGIGGIIGGLAGAIGGGLAAEKAMDSIVDGP